jgi:hypothetical protein
VTIRLTHYTSDWRGNERHRPNSELGARFRGQFRRQGVSLLDRDPKRHLAGDQPDLQFDTTQLFLGNRPIVVDFQKLIIETLKARIVQGGEAGARDGGADEDGKRLNDVETVKPYWRYYLVMFGLGVSKADRRLREVGLQLSYPEDSEKPVTVLDYWPKNASQTIFKGQLGGTLSMNIHGELTATDAAFAPVLRTIPLPFGAEIKLGGSGDVVAQLSFNISLPLVEAFGAYSSSSMWTFRHVESQQFIGQLIHTKRKVTSLRVRAALRAIYGGWFGTRAVEEKVIELSPALLREDD